MVKRPSRKDSRIKSNSKKKSALTDSIYRNDDSDHGQTIDKMDATVTLKGSVVNGDRQLNKIVIDTGQMLPKKNRNATYQANLKRKKQSQGIRQINVDVPEVNFDQFRAMTTIHRLLFARGITVDFNPEIRLLNKVLIDVEPEAALSSEELNKLKMGNNFISTPRAEILRNIQAVMCSVGMQVINTPQIWQTKNPTYHHIITQFLRNQSTSRYLNPRFKWLELLKNMYSDQLYLILNLVGIISLFGISLVSSFYVMDLILY